MVNNCVNPLHDIWTCSKPLTGHTDLAKKKKKKKESISVNTVSNGSTKSCAKSCAMTVLSPSVMHVHYQMVQVCFGDFWGMLWSVL